MVAGTAVGADRSRPGPGRRRWTRSLAGLVALLSAAAAAGCGGGDGESTVGDVVTGEVDFEATSGFLARAARRSLGEPYRIEMSMAMDISGDGEDLSIDAPLMTGEQDGTRYHMTMDMGEWMEELGAGGRLDTGELTTEMVGDDTVLYMRSPMFAAIAEQAGPNVEMPQIEELAELGDRWGRIDVTALGAGTLTDVQSTIGSPSGADPRALLDVVSNADDVEELGTDEVDGTGVNGLGATLTLGELYEAQGMDADELAQQMSASVGQLGGDADAAEMVEEVMGAEVRVDVWVDGEGYVRRLSYEMDPLAMLGALAEGARDEGIDEFLMRVTMEYSDYGDEGIAIELPPAGAEDAADVTETFGELAEMAERDQAASPGTGG